MMLQMSLAHKKFALAAAAAALLSVFSSCGHSKDSPIIIWTDNAEIVSYVELFNASSKDVRAVAVYKAEPARSLPPAKDELTPDLVIGSWLKNSATRKYFSPLNYLFQEKSLKRSLFYREILQYGEINGKQHLIPLSFNLPMLIFSRQNEQFVSSNHFLNLKQIQDAAAQFNRKNAGGTYTAIGYAPSWDAEFAYLVTKLYGAAYHEKGTSFLWNENAMEDAVREMRRWTLESNSDTASEQNFQFKYLYMPGYKQITTGRCLFSYATSDTFFTLTDAQISGLSFRWIEQDGMIPVEDSIITMGMYKKAEQPSKAESFISWLMNVETQKRLIERTEKMNLSTMNFGIAGGFSSLRDVNEKLYPAFYRQLLGNMPPEQYLALPNILPYRWKSLKANVILPYLQDSISTETDSPESTLKERIAEWTKQFY